MKTLKILFAFAIGLLMFSCTAEESYQQDRKQLLSTIQKNKLSIFLLRDTLSKHVRDSFLAQYRIKEERFFFTIWVNDKARGTFVIPENVQSAIVRNAEKLGIEKIMKRGGEKFYRFQLFDEGFYQGEIWVLLPTVDRLFHSEFSQKKYPIVNSFDSIDSYKGSFLYKVEDSLYFLFAEDEK
jgi:hypothetical protein